MDIESLRIICLKLPAVTEDIKWGNDLCFLIAGKMFCVTGLQEPLKVSLKVNADEFDELCSSAGIIPAPYMARNKWILVENPDRFSRSQWGHYIAQSYHLVRSKLPTKVLALLK